MLRRALVAIVLSGATACSGGHVPGEKGVDDPSLPSPTLPQPMEASVITDDDSGALDPGSRQNDGGVSEGGHVEISDAGVVNCSGPLAAGDVKIVEIMIASQGGSGDKGEWVELQSTRACILDIKGLTTTVGVEGIGRDGRLHSAHFIELSDQPVEVTFAVTEAQCAALLELLERDKADIFYVKTAVEFGVVGGLAG